MPNALVTGASGGIGRAIACALAQRGVNLALHYQSGRPAAEETRRILGEGAHTIVQADLCDPQAIERLWQEVSSRNRIDLLVHNAGIFPNHPPLSTDYAQWLEAWQRTLATNLSGPAHLAYFASRTMAAAGGRI